jgi:hypothetical protein
MADLAPAILPMMDLTQFRSMGSARTRRVTVLPENTSTVTGSTSTTDVQFALPSGRYSMINGQNSYLSFDYAITGSSTAAGASTLPVPLGPCGGTSHSFIRAIETIIQSQSVEYLDQYNVWAGIQQDFQSRNRNRGVGSILEGHWFDSATDVLPDTVAAADTAALVIDTGRVVNNMKATKVPFPHATTTVYRATLPLYSSVLGVLAQQYVPAMDGIRLRIVFDTVARSLFGATATAYTLTNIRLQMDYVDVEPAIHDQLVLEAGGILKTHSIGISNYQSTQTKSSLVSSILIPARFSAVKSILMCWRHSTNASSSTSTINKLSSRFFPTLDYFSWNVGGRQFPPTQIQCGISGSSNYTGSEAFMEVAKVFGELHSPDFEVNFTRAQYLGRSDVVTNTFVAGIDFEEYTGGDKVVSGLDTNSSNIYFQGVHKEVWTGGVDQDAVVDAFVVYDVIIEVLPS